MNYPPILAVVVIKANVVTESYSPVILPVVKSMRVFSALQPCLTSRFHKKKAPQTMKFHSHPLIRSTNDTEMFTLAVFNN